MRRWLEDWNRLNPVLADGEVGEIIGTLVTKTGDGKSPWKDLSFTHLGLVVEGGVDFATSADVNAAIAELVGTAPELLNTLGEIDTLLGTKADLVDGKVPAGQLPDMALDPDLAAIADLTTQPYGRSFLELADAPAGRTLLALGTAATAAVEDFSPAGAAVAGVIHAGTGTPPANVGLTGDYYHSTDLKRLYGPKGSDTAWGAAVMPTFHGATGRGGPGALAVPAGTLVGDLMLLYGTRFMGDVGSPTGWTLLSIGDGGNFDGKVFYRIATQTDIDNGITTTGDATYTQWNLLSYGNVDGAGVPDITLSQNAAASAIAAPTTTVPTDPDTLVVHAVTTSSVVADPGVTWTTRRASALNTTSIRIFDTPTTGTDATGPTFSASGNGWFYWTIVLDPAIVIAYAELSDSIATQAELDAVAASIPAATSYAQERVTITDDTDLTYILANTPVSTEALLVYLNGVLLQSTVDYTLSAATVTFAASVIVNTDIVTFVYPYGA